MNIKQKLFRWTLKRPGGGGVESTPPPSTFSATIPPREFFWPRRSLTFYFQVSRILWHQFRENRAYRYDAAHLLYMLVRPKMAQKRDFVYKVNANGVFSPYS